MSAASVEGEPDCTVEVYVSEESEESHSVTAGGSSKSESCQEF